MQFVELEQPQFKKDQLPMVLASLPDCLVGALNITLPRIPEMQVTRVDDQENVINQEASVPPVLPTFKDQSVMYLAASWVDPYLGGQRRSTQEPGEDSVPAMQRHRGWNVTNPHPKSGKGGDFLDILELVSSLKLDDQSKAAMTWLIAAMTLVCTVHDVDFRELRDLLRATVEQNFTEKVDFVLANPPYNGRQE